MKLHEILDKMERFDWYNKKNIVVVMKIEGGPLIHFFTAGFNLHLERTVMGIEAGVSNSVVSIRVGPPWKRNLSGHFQSSRR